MFLGKLDLSIKTEDFLKKVTSARQFKDHEERYGFKTSMFLHGTSDIMVLIWAKDVIEAKKLMNSYKNIFGEYIMGIDLLDIIATFRFNGIANPKIADEWTNLLI